MKLIQKIYWLRVLLGIAVAFICIGYLVAAESIPANLVFNPSVETADAGMMMPLYWSSLSQNGTEWSTNFAKTGSKSLRINVNNASAEWRSKAAKVHGGNGYQIRCFFRGEVDADLFLLTLQWFSDSEGLVFIREDSISIPIGNYSVWLPLGNAFVAPSETKSARAMFKAVNGSGEVYGDDFEVRQTEAYTKFLNSLSIALVVYIISYYIIKRKFILQVEKPQKLLTTGIGIYFITWLVFLILMYTIMAELPLPA